MTNFLIKKKKIPAPENGPYISNIGTVVSPVGENGSPGLPLTLDQNSSQQQTGITTNTTTNNNSNNKYNNNNITGSPDQSSLIVLQPSGTGYSSMLPSFSHYATGKFSFIFFFYLFKLTQKPNFFRAQKFL